MGYFTKIQFQNEEWTARRQKKNILGKKCSLWEPLRFQKFFFRGHPETDEERGKKNFDWDSIFEKVIAGQSFNFSIQKTIVKYSIFNSTKILYFVLPFPILT